MAQMTHEQMKALQEKLSSMSPEELKEYQIQNCIFCHIVGGKVQSKKVYEDEKILAILDINPANPGHMLILPKEHYAILPLVPDGEIEELAKVTKQMSNVALKALGAEGTTVFVANGVAAGQKAQHFMLHLIPRKQKDGLQFNIEGSETSEEKLTQIKTAIQPRINELLGEQVFPEDKVEEQKKGEEKAEPEEKGTEEPEEEKEEEPETEEKPEEETKFDDAQESKEEKEVDLDKITGLLSK